MFYSLQQLPLVIMTLAIAFSVHEFSHAYVAYKFGDDTAARQGRLTLNPLVHLDPLGTIFLIIAGFGWAKPVPVNPMNFKNPRKADILVSLAGPASNLIMGFVGMGIFVWLQLSSFGQTTSFGQTLIQFFSIFVGVNIMLCVFNLIPIPPLDGYHILFNAVPRKTKRTLHKFEVYGPIIFIILLVTPLFDMIFYPIIDGVTLVFQQIFLAIFL